MAYAFIQQGGASDEFYVSVWDTDREAWASRVDCATAAYATTPAVEMPDDTDWAAVETLVQSLPDLEVVAVPDDYDEPDD
ncbi:hypothetical protein [Nocardia brasiliensis]|uniref:hypothetical protein n=1 Tax=Nocardia brasiliensis TaxID=37326 RepID=UPI0024555D0B|nr:hypothetical protein [Nocardia brasiliensis]